MEEDEVLGAFEACMKKNENLGRYDVRYNYISDYGVEKIIEVMKIAGHVYEFEVSERISKKCLEDLRNQQNANKPKRGKKGGKGKKKKK